MIDYREQLKRNVLHFLRESMELDQECSDYSALEISEFLDEGVDEVLEALKKLSEEDKVLQRIGTKANTWQATGYRIVWDEE